MIINGVGIGVPRGILTLERGSNGGGSGGGVVRRGIRVGIGIAPRTSAENGQLAHLDVGKSVA